MRTKRIHRNSRSEAGMTMIELLIAGAVLVTGMLAVMVLLGLATGNNGRSKVDSTATMLSQSVVEQISAVLAGGGPGQITDCVNPPWLIESGNPALPPPNGWGAALAGGKIDFTQNNPPAGAFMNYIECQKQPNGAVVQVTYDVRWNVQTIPGGSGTYLITVGARPRGGMPTQFSFSLPVNMRVFAGGY